MFHIKKFHLIFFILSLVSVPILAVDFYVSPSGNDSNSGSLASPWKTISKAKEHIRTINNAMSENINIHLREGTYFLNQTLEFTPEDSGKNGKRIIYKTYNNENTVISGGTPVTGWTNHDGNIWKATLNRNEKLRQFYFNGSRAQIARTSVPVPGKNSWGNYSWSANEPWAATAGSSADGITFDSSVLGVNWLNPEDLEVSQRNGHTWREYFVSLRGLSQQSGTGDTIAKFQQPSGAMMMNYWNATVAVQKVGISEMRTNYLMLPVNSISINHPTQFITTSKTVTRLRI